MHLQFCLYGFDIFNKKGGHSKNNQKHFLIDGRMSRIYDNKPLHNLPVINVDIPGKWEPNQYSR